MHYSRKQWHFEVLDPQRLDRGELLSFLREDYGTGDAAQSDYFDWSCLMNPAGRAVIPIIRDTADGRLLAQNWLIPIRARVQGEIRSWALGVNYLVHRDYRREGLMRSMRAPTATALAQMGIELGIGFPNPKMVRAVQAYGDSFFLDPLDILVCPLDWSLLDQTRLRNTPGKAILQNAVGAVWPLLFPRRPADVSRSTLIVREIEDYDSLFDDFWKRVQDKYPVMLIRDSKFLQWRYQLNPLRQYLTYVAEESGVTVGYITLRSTEVLRLRVGAIADFLVEPSQRGEQAGDLLVAQATNYFQSQRSQLVACALVPSAHERAILQRQGFVSAPRSLQPQPVTMCFTPYQDPLRLETLCDLQNWFLTLGDYDII